MNEHIADWYEKHSGEVVDLAKKIWENPEASMEEYEACVNTAKFLVRHGFSVTTFHCSDKEERPNALVATIGDGYPVIGFLGEYDALPGIGQDAIPFESPKPGCGHGCGHNLMTPACASAAVAAWNAMKANGLKGTLKFIACPAEETLEGKLALMKLGVFDGLSCCLTWHPMGYEITPFECILQAMSNYKFEFFGKAAHAALSPEAGRSALDAAELMNIGVQYLREHIPSDVRIHYTYLAAGDKPNIVPSYAALHYVIRSADQRSNTEIIERVKDIARGAALMTGTTTQSSLMSETSETCVIYGFNRFLYRSLQKIPQISYSEETDVFARTLYQNVVGKPFPADKSPLVTGIKEPTYTEIHAPGSTDVGPVTKAIPTARLFGLGVLRDIPAHHWGVTACAGTEIGFEAACFAGKALAQCAVDILAEPQVIDEWWEELHSKHS